MNDELTIEQQIEDVISREIRPYIEMDGGRIHFIEYRNNIVYVELSGACGSCPSSTMTLKGGVERIIKRRFPEVQAVTMAGLDAPAAR